MNGRLLAGLAAIIAGVLAGRSATGQAPADRARAGLRQPAAAAIPRAEDGHPDLQGVWLNRSATPLERPQALEGRATLSDEEVAELKHNISDLPQPIKPAGGHAGSRTHEVSPELQERIEAEVGDLFFVLVNLSRFLNVDPESALRRTTQKFRRRFEAMENQAREQERRLEEMNIEQMEALWQNSKAEEVKH